MKRYYSAYTITISHHSPALFFFRSQCTHLRNCLGAHARTDRRHSRLRLGGRSGCLYGRHSNRLVSEEGCRPCKTPSMVFAFCETGIGIFGIFSTSLLHSVQHFCAILPLLPGLLTIIAIVAMIFPTMLMGATFPLVSQRLCERYNAV